MTLNLKIESLALLYNIQLMPGPEFEIACERDLFKRGIAKYPKNMNYYILLSKVYDTLKEYQPGFFQPETGIGKVFRKLAAYIFQNCLQFLFKNGGQKSCHPGLQQIPKQSS